MFRFLTVLVIVAGCGGNKTDKKTKDDAAPGPTVAPIAIPTSGVDSVKRMNYQWSYETIKEYGRTLAACCTKNKPPDWSATRTHAESVLAKDPQNIGAHWLLTRDSELLRLSRRAQREFGCAVLTPQAWAEAIAAASTAAASIGAEANGVGAAD